jgi:hypothetical protein
MTIRATHVNQSFFPGIDVEGLWAQQNGIALNQGGHVPNNTAVTFIVGAVPHDCCWNGYGSIKGAEYPNEWFADLGVGHPIICDFDPVANAVVVQAGH